MALGIGALTVLVAVFGGFLMEKGNLHILYQPAEFVIICGAALGGFIIATPFKVMGSLKGNLLRVVRGKMYGKQDYIELLLLLNELLFSIRKDGLMAIEAHVEKPEKSDIFRRYPTVSGNPTAFSFILDTLRTIITTTLSAHELESLLDNEMESVYEESQTSARSVSDMADALPGLGIVAAVLGVVITMQKMGEPPEVLGHSIGAAMVGTFLGILLSYGFVGPLGKKLEHLASDERDFLDVIRNAFVSFTGGANYQIALEFGRRVIPPHVKPSFDEMEKAIKKSRERMKWKSKKTDSDQTPS